MSTLSDVRDFIIYVSNNAKIFPHVNRSLVISSAFVYKFDDSPPMYAAELIAESLAEVAAESLTFNIDVSRIDESSAGSVHAARFDLTGCFSDIDFFCVVDSLQFERSMMDALNSIKSAASRNAILLLLLPDLNDFAHDLSKDLWLFDKDYFISIFGDSLISVEKFGSSWLVLTSIPDKFNDACVFNSQAQRPIPISSKYYPPFFTSHQLDDIGIDCATDKSSRLHGYLLNYEFFLSRFKSESFTLMELGVLYGSSVKMWSRYFPNAKIVGVDINPNCLKFQTDSIHIEIANLKDANNVIKLRDFNASIIIDDASHSWKDQILAISLLFSSLPHGGVYIIEDLETSFAGVTERFTDFRDFFDFNMDAVSFIEAVNRVVMSGTCIKDVVDPSVLSFLERLSIEEMDLCEVIDSIGLSASFVALMHGSAVFVKR